MPTYVRINHDGPAYGRVDGDSIAVLEGHPFQTAAEKIIDHVPLAGLTLLAPVLPTKIVCVGRNYPAHASELGNDVPSEPLVFLKPSSSVIGPGERILHRGDISNDIQFEGELAIVIGALASRITAEQATERMGEPGAVIRGFTIANDITARDLQKSDGQWSRAKGFDSFCPLGPSIVTDLDLGTARIRTYVGEDCKQDAPLADMVFGVGEIIAHISNTMTLLPGDIILTGTPSGVGPITPGDLVRVEIDGLGALANPVIDASAKADA